MKTIINLIKNKVSLVTGLILMSILSYGQMSLTTTGVAVTQNFNSIGTTATASLPSGFRLGQNVAYSSGVSNTTVAAGTSGAGIIATTGGYYNFGDGVNLSSTDRSVGVLTSSGFTSPRDLMLQIQNNTGGIVTDLSLTFKYE